jgi:serine/threonine protein kinase
MEMVNAIPIAGAFAEKTCLQEMGFHPFLVKFLRTFHDTTRLFVAMELVKGQPLYTIMTQQCPHGFPEDCVRHIMAETIMVIDHLHKRNIIYRDLKLENILLTETGNIKLIDLGYAKLLIDIHTEKAWSKLGTPEYMAPEMLDETGHSFHVDLWALGIIIFELLTTATPFVAGSIEEIFERIEANRVRYPDSLSSTVVDLISGLLKTNPNERLKLNEVKSHPWFAGIVWDADTLAVSTPPALVQLAIEANNNFKKAVVGKTGGTRLRLPEVQTNQTITEKLELEDEFADF